MRPLHALALSALVSACGSDAATQHEITQPGDLLTVDGRLREPGWARAQLLRYDASRVHDPTMLRRWDFFAVEDGAAAVNLTITDLGIIKLATVGAVDFASGTQHSAGWVAGAADDFTLADAIVGSSSFTPHGAAMPDLRFTTTSDTTTVDIALPQGLLGDAASGTLTVHRRAQADFLSLATPFDEDPTDFFYEQKIPGMSAEGTITIGAWSHTFTATGATAVEDWGRGQWPSMVTWRWASASGAASDGTRVALNLGEGFGDAQAGTENIVIVDDRATKLATVGWSHDATDLTRDWSFTSPDGAVALVLHPVAQEAGNLDLGDKYEHLHKVYGPLSGTLALAGGRTLVLDGGSVIGAAEEMDLAW